MHAAVLSVFSPQKFGGADCRVTRSEVCRGSARVLVGGYVGRRACRHHDEDTHRRLRHAQLCGFAKTNDVETNGHSL